MIRPFHTSPGIAQPPAILRRRWCIRGQVQGVGFRPFVYRIATACNLAGRVWNDAQGVVIEAQGIPPLIADFERRLTTELPPLARIDHIESADCDVPTGGAGHGAEQDGGFKAGVFQILASEHDGEAIDAGVAVDSAICPDCLRELLDRRDRRHRHGLINCTNCGPRFTILREVPYDRVNTTMARFHMCPMCAREYQNPADRRFHAQPVCCPSCGPRISLVRVEQGRPHTLAGEPFREAAHLLLAGQILAVKGLGGFHLAVRADSEPAVARLRALKKRDAKPFALMCRDLDAARKLVALSPAAERELASPRAPILLAKRQEGGGGVASSVAPGTHLLGVMLPYTPMHHLIWEALASLTPDPPPLVMTSGNISSEPLAIDNDEALGRLAAADGPLCDAILWHDRPIERCLDDSVILDAPHGLVPIRRSRGYVPTAFPLPNAPAEHPTGLCLGGELKNTIAIVRRHEIILSQHLGDLTNSLAYEYFEKAIADLIRLFGVRVDFIAHDLHPAYMSTLAAQRLAKKYNARLIPVQHHHAHAAAVMAEHGLAHALALVCDGTGFGPDQTTWGGEVLLVGGGGGGEGVHQYRRLGRIKPFRLPGGDAAAKDPRRSALALLHTAYGGADVRAAHELGLAPADLALLQNMIRKGINSPWTSSTGRLFDAAAALLGICDTNQHEAQAAMALEAAAFDYRPTESDLPRQIPDPNLNIQWNAAAGVFELDPGPLVRSLVEGRAAGMPVAGLAAAFHEELARGLLLLVQKSTEDLEKGAPRDLVVSGGVFCNGYLSQALVRQAPGYSYRAFFHESYPPTDGGLALGQAAVACEGWLTSALRTDKR